MNTQWGRVLFWLFGCWLLISGQAFADGYSKGLDAFRDGEYSKAYKILSGVVKKAKDKTDKAEAMALMGAAAAKMGKKSKAESLFNKALKLDPDVSLSKDAVKDKSVRKLFSKAKKGSGGGDEDDGGGDFDDEKSEKMASKGGGSSYKGFIPLGLGFLFNGEVSKGLIYGGAQAAGLVGFLYYNGEIAKANKDADAIGQQALAQQAAGQAVDQETLDFLDQNEAFVKAAQNNQRLMVLILGAGYGLSVADGLFFGGGSKKSRGKKRAEVFPLSGEAWADGSSSSSDMQVVEEEPRLWDMKLHLVPRRDPAVMLSVNRNF